VKATILPFAYLFGLVVISHAIAAIFGRLLPRTGIAIALVTLLVVVAMWLMLAIQEPPNGPGGGLGLAIFSAASLVLLSAGVGLIAGSKSNIGISLGLLVGLLGSAVIHLWLYTPASPIIGACLLASLTLTGYALGACRRVSNTLVPTPP